MFAGKPAPVVEADPPSRIGVVNGTVWREISDPLSPFLGDVRRCLDSQLKSFEPEVADGARYALSASGKQLRPVLVALSAQTVGGIAEAHITGATIVELVHLATLVHDDVIDAADLRRKRPTLAARYGNQTAVLLGDCLFAHALKLAAGFPTPDICRAVSNATKAVVSGEILQTLRKGRLDQPLEEYFRVIRLKTAELFALACELGPLLADAPPAHRIALRRFGLVFGTAYQIFDDCLDVFGSEESAGKTLGTDLANGKFTLPLLLTHQNATTADRARLEQLLRRASTGQARRVRTLLDHYEAGPRSRAVVESYLEQAREALAPLSNSPAVTSLSALTHYLEAQVSRLASA